MLLGIEIGGTKLQLGVGRGDGSPLVELVRLDVQRSEAAAGIRRQIETAGRRLVREHGVKAVGIGFGGPVNAAEGRTVTSHQVEGWNDFPLVDWVRETFGLPAALANDADAAGLAEARFGAGRGHRVVFYITVGSGIGGALVLDGMLYGGGRGVASELGHLRPGPEATDPHDTVEAAASGFGLAAAAQRRLADSFDDARSSRLITLCGGRIERITGKMVAEAAAEGDPLAREVFDRGLQTLGWAIAQMATLVAPEVVVLGGGVPLLGESLFFEPLRRQCERYSFPPLRGSYHLMPAALGEEVVVHGALAVAAG